MASIFLDSQGVIIIDYLEQGHTINGAYYAGEMKWLQQEIAKKEARKTDPPCSALAGLCPYSHVKLP